MKFYNKTRYPDDLLEPILIEAGKAVGARTTGVIVKATQAKPGHPHCYGIARRADWVRRFALDTRSYRKGTYQLKKGEVSTDGGYFTITLPYPFVPDWVKQSEIYPRWLECRTFEALSIAELIFSVASHEWQHIRQYQEGSFNFRDKTEHRKHHDNRAWEKDAIKASSKATAKPKDRAQEAILNLAVWLDEHK